MVDGGKCYFCNVDLQKVDRKEKLQLECCGIYTHKNESYSWFLRNQHCPSCLAVNSKDRQKILEWGMNKKRAKSKKSSIKTSEHKPKKFEKSLRFSQRNKNRK